MSMASGSSRNRKMTASDLLGPRPHEDYVPVRREDCMPVHRESFAGRISERFGPKETERLRAQAANVPADRVDQNELNAISRDALQQHYGTRRHGAKRLAEDANCSPRAAKNWLEGVNAPDLLHAIRIMGHCPPFAAAMRRLAAMYAEGEPQFMHDFTLAMQSFARWQAEQEERAR